MSYVMCPDCRGSGRTISGRASCLRCEGGGLVQKELDPDRPCPHEHFHANVDVSRLAGPDEKTIVGYSADVKVWCGDCDESFRFVGVQCGLRPDRPMCSADETELRAPIRPASSDPDFGMGIPGFAVRWRDEAG